MTDKQHRKINDALLNDEELKILRKHRSDVLNLANRKLISVSVFGKMQFEYDTETYQKLEKIETARKFRTQQIIDHYTSKL